MPGCAHDTNIVRKILLLYNKVWNNWYGSTVISLRKWLNNYWCISFYLWYTTTWAQEHSYFGYALWIKVTLMKIELIRSTNSDQFNSTINHGSEWLWTHDYKIRQYLINLFQTFYDIFQMLSCSSYCKWLSIIITQDYMHNYWKWIFIHGIDSTTTQYHVDHAILDMYNDTYHVIITMIIHITIY